MFSSITDISDSRKQELVASLAALLVGSCTSQEVTADAISAVAEASGNSVSSAYATLFSSVVNSARGIDKFCAAPGAGGGGGGGGAVSGGPAAAAKVEEKPEEKEEEEEMDLGGGMDMFGGGGASGGGDY